MKKRADGRYQKKITVNGESKVFYGKSIREINEKIREHTIAAQIKEERGELFENVATEWLTKAVESLSPTTIKGYSSHYKRAVERFSGQYIKDINIKEISDFVNSLGLSKKSAKNQLSILSTIFEYGIVNYGLENNPCRHVVITQGQTSSKRRALTEREIELIQQNCDGTDGLFANMLLLTGLRRGEILALQYKDIDRTNNLIYVSKSVYYDGNKPYLKKPKTDAGVREVVLLPPLDSLIPNGRPNSYIFSDDDGKTPMHNKSSATLWNKYAKRIGLDGITPHYLRHNYATMLYKSGIDVKTAQFLLGHRDIQTTMNIYTHVSREMLSSVREKLIEKTM